jgi:hypothetical protein
MGAGPMGGMGACGSDFNKIRDENDAAEVLSMARYT